MNDYKTKNTEQKNQRSGTLYVVATPIGNLEDITLRALKILKKVPLIAAENTNHTRGLCSHYGIRARLTSYNQHNRISKSPELIKILKSGSDVALVTNAGTPAVSDPGSLLINSAHGEGIKVSPIPGPSAAIAALSVCGLKVDRFVFIGFPPSRSGKRKKYLREFAHEQRTIIFYEAPHRVKALLNDLADIFGDRPVVILRELTKVYEEIKRAPLADILKGMDKDQFKGEFTVILGGGGKEGDLTNTDIDVGNRIRKLLMEKDKGVKDIALRLSSETGINYRIVYRECLNIMKEMGP